MEGKKKVEMTNEKKVMERKRYQALKEKKA